jgi:recombination protein RecT
MSNAITYLQQNNVAEKFEKLIGSKKGAAAFLSSTLTILSSSDLLKNATKESVYNAALMAATLNLPLNANLGLAYIVPFNNRKTGNQEAQFQIGYKGYIQLAMRSGQFKTVSASPIYEGQIISENPLSGYEFDFSVKGGALIGYAAYFKLTNGFEKTIYQSVQELKAHGLKYSQTFKRGFGVWDENFDAMAIKTMLKLLLSKYAPLSIEMEKAIISDSSVIEDAENLNVKYSDNTPLSLDEVQLDQDIKQALKAIDAAKTTKDIEPIGENLERLGDSVKTAYNEKMEVLNNG